MKFLCDNCKAKYQIPDEKIRGRTLKMKCRKCEHPILIRGPQTASAAASKPEASKPAAPKPAAPRRAPSSAKPAPRRRGGSSVGPRPAPRPSSAAASALGAEFRRGALAPEPAPQRAAVEWYVAINDVPVGPIKRDELARKVGTGSVTGKNLCWREGMDDWKPLEQVAELASLVAARRVPAPPPRAPGGSLRSAPQPPEEGSGRSNVVPIGGRMGATAYDENDEATVMAPPPAMAESSSPDLSPLPIGAPIEPGAEISSPGFTPAPAASAPPAAAPMPAEPAEPSQSRGLPPPLLIALVGAGAFGVALALIAGKAMFAEEAAETVAEATVDPLAEDDAPEPELVLDDEGAGEEEVAEAAEAEGEEEEAADDAPTTRRTTRRTTTTTPMTAEMEAPTKMLSAEQQALLERFGGNDTSGPSLMSVDIDMATSAGREQLDANAVRRVVSASANQRALRRCYETAIRGASDAPSVRMDVSVRVGASGTVTRVSATGRDYNGLRACIERTVRRWRFPASSNGGETRFPVVFSPTG